jgi:thiol-disulfide isomerase/thioredoxin
MELSPKHFHAPELYGDFWYNSEPISIRALQGYVVLLDFWDYSNLNSVRALPYMNEWYRKYQEFGLVVVGVHTPEFQFGKKPEYVERAVREAGIEYPVVMDNEAIIWNAYAARSWPTKYLVDKDGFVRFMLTGVGGYEQFERAIQALLSEAGVRGELPQLTEPQRDIDRWGAVCYRTTADISFGYLRGTIGNIEGYNPESTIEYTDPGLYLPGRFYAHGRWTDKKESLQFNGDEEGYLIFLYEALEVHGVMSAEDSKQCMVFVEQDGKMLTEENKGADIVLTDEGYSVLPVSRPRLYHIVRNKEFGSHRVKLRTICPSLAVYTLSFTASAVAELMSNN